MKKRNRLLSVAVGAVSVGLSSFGGVYDNVYYWSKGIAKDLNADGILDANESYEALNGQPSYSLNIGSHKVFYTNMWVALPERGVRRHLPVLYLPQTVEITNEVNNSGRGYPNTFQIPNSRVSAITTQTQADAHYAVFMRVRPERTQPTASNSWLFNFGHGLKKGVMVGSSGVYSPTAYSYTMGGIKYEFTNYTAGVNFCYGGSNWKPDTSQCKFVADTWNDVVISVSGQKMSVLVSHDNHLFSDGSSLSNSTASIWGHYYGEKTVGDDWNLVPNSTATFQIGGESYASSQLAWANGINNNMWKCFRGAVQCLALWTNSLTKAQMLEAAAYPRMDLWRVGLENDSTSECETAAAGAEVDPDAARWSVPELRAGQSVSFKFPLNATGEALMNNFLRIRTTSQSPTATLKVVINGMDLMSEVVLPGRMKWWFVDKTKATLLSGATNTITVIRTDSGSGSVALDSVRYGGSFQYGEADGSSYEFNQEGKTQDTFNSVFDLMGANWAVGSRAVFATGSYVDDSGKTVIATPYTNQVISFFLPDDIGKIAKYRITGYSSGTGTIQFNLNGHDIGEHYAPYKTFSIDIPDEYLKPEENILKFMNVMERKGTWYLAPDYIRIEALHPKKGLVLICR